MNLNDSFESRFWKKVNKTDTCWLWTASVLENGYGQITQNEKGEMVKAHRASYFLHHGEIPEGLLVCHTCDVRTCVRPDHLFLGTCADNHRDRNEKDRQAKGETVGNSRITGADVQSIRLQYSQGASRKSLALQFSISVPNVHCIVNRITWKHVI